MRFGLVLIAYASVVLVAATIAVTHFERADAQRVLLEDAPAQATEARAAGSADQGSAARAGSAEPSLRNAARAGSAEPGAPSGIEAGWTAPGEAPAPALAAPAFLNLNVPFISEAPGGNFVAPWNNACEEASIAMIGHYYQGMAEVPSETAQDYMWNLFAVQNRIWGSNANSDAARTVRIINEHTGYRGTIVENPSLEQIKEELRQGRPVMSFHHGFSLGNKNIPFLATGSSFHVIVVKGYDDAAGQFITNDDGDAREGADYRYDYAVFMDSLHDYVFSRARADGPARVIFTAPIVPR